MTRWSEGRSLHVGLNTVSASAYRDWLPDLAAAEADARAMRDLADSMGCSTRTLLGEAATRDAFVGALESVIERSLPGDFLMISYSGHMPPVAGIGDDADGWDEAWCLHDRMVLDDEFHDLLAEVPAGVDVLVVTDSCFSAGAVDDPEHSGGRLSGTALAAAVPAWGAAGAANLESLRSYCANHGLPTPELLQGAGAFRGSRVRAPRLPNGSRSLAELAQTGAIPSGRAPVGLRPQIVARVVALSAASETSSAYEGEDHGYFTKALLNAMEATRGAPPTYAELIGLIDAQLGNQRPSVAFLGGADESAFDAPAFAAETAAPSPRSGVSHVFDADGGETARRLQDDETGRGNL